MERPDLVLSLVADTLAVDRRWRALVTRSLAADLAPGTARLRAHRLLRAMWRVWKGNVQRRRPLRNSWRRRLHDMAAPILLTC